MAENFNLGRSKISRFWTVPAVFLGKTGSEKLVRELRLGLDKRSVGTWERGAFGGEMGHQSFVPLGTGCGNRAGWSHRIGRSVELGSRGRASWGQEVAPVGRIGVGRWSRKRERVRTLFDILRTG